MNAPSPPVQPENRLLRRLPILVILAVAVAGLVFLGDHFGLAKLAEHRSALMAFRDAHYGVAVVAFMAGYALLVACSLPGATLATLTGGFLFGLFPGVVFNVLAAGTGANILFHAARAGFAGDIAERIARSEGAARLQAGLQRNEWAFLFVMRLVPLVPFFVANLLPAFVGVQPHRFAIATFVGIIPGALLYTAAGSGLGVVFDAGTVPAVSSLVSPWALVPLAGVVIAVAVLWRRVRP